MTTVPTPEGPGAPGDDVLAELLLDSMAMHPEDLAAAIARAEAFGGRNAQLWLADLNQASLHLFAPIGEQRSLPVHGTDAGRAYRGVRPVEVAHEAGAHVLWLPLLNSAERLGVVSIELDGPVGDSLRGWQAFVALLARLVATMSTYSDALVLGRRRAAPTLAAEMRMADLPPLAFTTPGVSIAGMYEPAYEIAGDTFDYAVIGRTVHVALFDAMGHGLEASRMANLTVAAYRSARRRSLTIEETAVEIDTVIASEFGDSRYVTGQLAVLDIDDGVLTLIDLGHPRPLLLRAAGGSEVVDCTPSLPLGLRGGEPARARVQLAPGDAVLFYTDGITDARGPDGERFGEAQLAQRARELVAEGRAHSEVLRVLVAEALDHQGGKAEDDATTVLLGWHPDGT